MVVVVLVVTMTRLLWQFEKVATVHQRLVLATFYVVAHGQVKVVHAYASIFGSGVVDIDVLRGPGKSNRAIVANHMRLPNTECAR